MSLDALLFCPHSPIFMPLPTRPCHASRSPPAQPSSPHVSDPHDLAVTRDNPLVNISRLSTLSPVGPVLPVTARHGRARPSFKRCFPPIGNLPEIKGRMQECRVLPASSPCSLNESISHIRMSKSSGSDYPTILATTRMAKSPSLLAMHRRCLIF